MRRGRDDADGRDGADSSVDDAGNGAPEGSFGAVTAPQQGGHAISDDRTGRIGRIPSPDDTAGGSAAAATALAPGQPSTT
jgi:hypothetical protein